jgi:FlaA1/EpsC-like NDP-sugar epimerase
MRRSRLRHVGIQYDHIIIIRSRQYIKASRMRTLNTLTFAVLLIQQCTVIQCLSSTAIRTQQPIQRIAIVGSGIAGLSLAHALENSPDLRGDGAPIQVTLFDARPSLNYEVGAGVQLNGGE